VGHRVQQRQPAAGDFDRIKAGDRVTCVGNPSATGRPEMYMWSIKLADGTEFAR
jgi:hypothetical protein